MVQIRKNVVHALMYFVSFLLPLAVIFGGKDVEEDTRYQSVQALLLQALQVIIAVIIFIIRTVLGLGATAAEGSYFSIVTGIFSFMSGILSAIPWVFQAGLVVLAILAFFDRTFHLPLIEPLAERITPKIYRNFHSHGPSGT